VDELDGNVAAGALREVFALEVTTARGRCDGCGNVAQLGEACAYVNAPGIVIRCRRCDRVQLVLVRRNGSYVLAMSGMTWVELGAK